jgi:integrase
MAGQVIRRGDRTFLIRWHLGRGGDGKRRYGSKTIHGTKKEAEAALREVLRNRDLGVIVESRRVSLEAYLAEWIEKAARGRLRPRTLRDYQYQIDHYITPELGHLRLDRVTPLEIQGLVTKLSARGLSPASVRHTHAVLSGALRQAVKWRLLALNPASAVDLPRKRPREMQALEPEQATRFCKAIEGTRHEALMLLLLGTGLRPSEALALRWDDLDLEAGRLAVRRTLPRRVKGEELRFEDPKTPSARRVSPIPPTVVAALKRHRAAQAAERLKVADAYADLGLVFASELGMPLDQRNVVNRHFKPALRRAGIPETLRQYDLRHSFASLALAAGAHVKTVSDRMGHASAKMTLDVYSHVSEPVEQDATERIEATIFGGS